MMFTVTWEIDVEADSHEEAAQKALEIQRDPESIATCFEVVEKDDHVNRTLRTIDNTAFCADDQQKEIVNHCGEDPDPPTPETE